MDYLHKIEKEAFEDLFWNIPEQKQGSVAVIGGNGQSFRTPVKVAEYLATQYPIKDLRLVLPDALRGKIPEMPEMIFLKATESGSFAEGEELKKVCEAADFNLIIGDLSKNSITGRAVVSACENSAKPVILTRDAVDLAVETGAEQWLMNPEMIILESLMQMQKMFRAVYYPKMITMSQSMVQIAEALHKFTLSYPVGIVTLVGGQILVAKNGSVNAVPLERTGYSPLSLWMGEAVAKIAALNLYNPGKFLEATTAALMGSAKYAS